jgi:hypothetical protein
MNKEINRHMRALTFDNTSLENYAQSLPFVQRILNCNHRDRLKISASQLLYGNILNLDRGIFLPAAERLLVESKPLPRHMSQMLKMQDMQNSFALIFYLFQQNSNELIQNFQSIPMSWCIIVQGRHLLVCILHGVVL